MLIWPSRPKRISAQNNDVTERFRENADIKHRDWVWVASYCKSVQLVLEEVTQGYNILKIEIRLIWKMNQILGISNKMPFRWAANRAQCKKIISVSNVLLCTTPLPHVRYLHSQDIEHKTFIEPKMIQNQFSVNVTTAKIGFLRNNKIKISHDLHKMGSTFLLKRFSYSFTEKYYVFQQNIVYSFLITNL